MRLSGLHWASSGIAAFTRGLNNTPKIAALGVTFFALHGPLHTPPFWLFLLCAAAVGLGSALGGLQVTRTLAEKVTKMDHQEGFAANLATALLVGLASPLLLPVSTTHVSSGAIIGISLRKGMRGRGAVAHCTRYVPGLADYADGSRGVHVLLAVFFR
ncbi:inorganic phosphate transporter [Ktedonosporobacter rubrisoli]|uniref:inorganic phosphate transporter n=1 Tax=Ktedonosporobacter rubrisoli TaxID=2509675 RepID=UPI002414305C|nr:inorganic phosphate transporter [Ktedonosporobacter rubrisoli]